MKLFDTMVHKNAVQAQLPQLEILRVAHHEYFKKLLEQEKSQLTKERILRLKPPDAVSPFVFVTAPTLIVKTDPDVKNTVIFSDFSESERKVSVPDGPEVLFEEETTLYTPSHNAATHEPIDFLGYRPLDALVPKFRDESTAAVQNVWNNMPAGESTALASQVLFIQILDEYSRIFSAYFNIFIMPPMNKPLLEKIFATKQQIFLFYMMFHLQHALDKNPYAYTLGEMHKQNFTLLETYILTRAGDPYPFIGAGTGTDRNTKLKLALSCYDSYVKNGKVDEALKLQANRGSHFRNNLAAALSAIDKNLASAQKLKK